MARNQRKYDFPRLHCKQVTTKKRRCNFHYNVFSGAPSGTRTQDPLIKRSLSHLF